MTPKMMQMMPWPIRASYSQIGEDAIAQHYLCDCLGIEAGVYVDVGAGHPVRYNNTYAFYRRGWRGALVEPLGHYVAEYAAARSGDYVITAAVGSFLENAQASLYVFDVSELSTVVTAVRDEYIRKGERCTGHTMVRTSSLENILADVEQQFRAATLLSLDVEGAEMEALQSNDWKTHRPTMLIVETRDYKTPGLGREPAITYYLFEQDYRRVADTGLNTIYVAAEVADKL